MRRPVALVMAVLMSFALAASALLGPVSPASANVIRSFTINDSTSDSTTGGGNEPPYDYDLYWMKSSVGAHAIFVTWGIYRLTPGDWGPNGAALQEQFGGTVQKADGTRYAVRGWSNRDGSATAYIQWGTSGTKHYLSYVVKDTVHNRFRIRIPYRLVNCPHMYRFTGGNILQNVTTGDIYSIDSTGGASSYITTYC